MPETNFSQVFTNSEKLVETNPDFVYMVIPAKYVCTYHKLLVMLADVGIEMLNDCTANCKGNNKNIITCWNMFQTACAAYQINKTKEADTIIKYINAQIKLIYNGTEKETIVGNITLPISEDGILKAIISCGGETPKFEVDDKSGIVIGTTPGTAFDGARGLNNENILKSVPNKLITDVSVIAQDPNDDVIIRTTYSERTNNDGSYVANKYRDYQLPEAQQGRAGLMSASDKVKLDSIYNEYIINDENFFSVSQGQAFTLTTWGKSNFNAFRDAILNGKPVQLYLSSYEDGAEANINVPCEVAVNAKTLIITYVIPDLLKQVKATLTINDNNDNVSCSITNVINLTEVGSGGSDYTLPIASATTLGGIKIPANGQMTIDKDGNLYPNAATSNSAGIVRPGIRSGLSMNESSISVTLGRKDIKVGTLSAGGTITGGRYYIYDDTVAGNASIKFKLNNNINSWEDPLAIIIVNRKKTGGMYFEGNTIVMLTATNDCTKIGAIFIRYFQNVNESGFFVWAVPNVL